jgi:hypothetical protein
VEQEGEPLDQYPISQVLEKRRKTETARRTNDPEETSSGSELGLVETGVEEAVCAGRRVSFKSGGRRRIERKEKKRKTNVRRKRGRFSRVLA